MAAIQKSSITTHILDTSHGCAAKDVPTSLHRYSKGEGEWKLIKHSLTNQDGRCTDLMEFDTLTLGMYKLTFHTKLYFDKLGVKTFFPYAEVVFNVEEIDGHYHVPLLLSAFSYSTYRGT